MNSCGSTAEAKLLSRNERRCGIDCGGKNAAQHNAMQMEQVKEEQLHHRSASDRAELDSLDQELRRREEIITADCHWSISPAWCYAIALSRRSVEQRLSSTAQLANTLGGHDPDSTLEKVQ
jgi:hypothetical protein